MSDRLRVRYRSECMCICHSRTGVFHAFPCCSPDPMPRHMPVPHKTVGSTEDRRLLEFQINICGLADVCIWAYKMGRSMLVRRIMEGLGEMRVEATEAQKKIIDEQTLRIMEGQNK